MTADDALQRIRDTLWPPEDPEREISGADFIDWVSMILEEYEQTKGNTEPGGVEEIPEGFFMVPVQMGPPHLFNVLDAFDLESRPDHVIVRNGRDLYAIQASITQDDVMLHVPEEVALRAYNSIPANFAKGGEENGG